MPLSEQANSKNEIKNFGLNNISEKEYEGINNSYEEPALEPENSEIEAKNEGINISNEEPALEPENSEIEAKTEGINISNEENSKRKQNMRELRAVTKNLLWSWKILKLTQKMRE